MPNATILFFRVHPVERLKRCKGDLHIIKSHIYENNSLQFSIDALDGLSITDVVAKIRHNDRILRAEYIGKYLGAHQKSSRNSPFISGCRRITRGQLSHTDTNNLLLAFNVPEDYCFENPQGLGEAEYLIPHYIERKYFIGIVNATEFSESGVIRTTQAHSAL